MIEIVLASQDILSQFLSQSTIAWIAFAGIGLYFLYILGKAYGIFG